MADKRIKIVDGNEYNLRKETKMASLGFGLVGYGAWGSCHAQAIFETPECDLRVICAHSPESQAKAAHETKAAVTGDLRELLSRSDVDVVDIVVPNHLHESVAVAALESGKHVLLEKPMATSVAACNRIIDAASRSGRRVLIGHEMRFSPLYSRMQEIIKAGELGQPRYVVIDLWRRPYRQGADHWRYDPARVGNWTLEEPVHFFDLAAWFLSSTGTPSTVYATGNSRNAELPARADMADNFTAIITFSNGAYALISESLAAVENHFTVKVFGSQSLLRAEWHAELDRSTKPSFFLEKSNGDHLEPVKVPGTPGEFFELRVEIAGLARAIREGTPLPITPEEGRRAVVLCLEAQRSLETGRVVILDSSQVSVPVGDHLQSPDA